MPLIDTRESRPAYVQFERKTVEDLAQANDEARRKIGMGSMELVEKAIAWMKQANSPQAKITEELTAMKEQIRRLTGQVEAQVELIQGLKVENAELLEKSRDIHPA